MPDISLLRKAGRQHGIISFDQLADLGYDRRQIQYRINAGLLVRVYRRVYGVPGARMWSVEFRVMAACLAAYGLASYRCAAALFEHCAALGAEQVGPACRVPSGFVACHRSITASTKRSSWRRLRHS